MLELPDHPLSLGSRSWQAGRLLEHVHLYDRHGRHTGVLRQAFVWVTKRTSGKSTFANVSSDLLFVTTV